MNAPALRSEFTETVALPPAVLRASPGIRRVMVSGLRANAAEGHLHLNADLLVRESMSASGCDELDEVLNYEIVVHTLRRTALLDSSLHDIAEHACLECFQARDVVEVRIDVAWQTEARDAPDVAVAHRVRPL